MDWTPPDISHINDKVVETPLGAMPRGSRPVGVSAESFERVVSTVERLYRQHRGMPAVELVLQSISMPARKVLRIMSSREFANELAMRGISWTSKAGLTRELTPEQQMVLALVTDPANKKSLRQKLDGAGVSYSVYRNWLSQPAFREAISAISENMLGDHIADVHASVVQKASNGDIQAARLVYELTGRHDPSKQQMVDLTRIVGLLLEVLTRHVRDPQTIGRIHGDFDRVIKGDTLPALEQLPRNYSEAEENEPSQAHHLSSSQQALSDLFDDATYSGGSGLQRSVDDRGDSPDHRAGDLSAPTPPLIPDDFFDFKEDE